MPTPQKFSDLELVSTYGRCGGNINQTAKALGVTRRAVKNRKAKLPDTLFITDIKEFRQKRADIFTELQRMIMVYVADPKKLKKASLQQLGTLFGIMYDKERLERDLSTENIAHDMHGQLDEEDRKLIREMINNRTQKKIAEVTYDED